MGFMWCHCYYQGIEKVKRLQQCLSCQHEHLLPIDCICTLYQTFPEINHNSAAVRNVKVKSNLHSFCSNVYKRKKVTPCGRHSVMNKTQECLLLHGSWWLTGLLTSAKKFEKWNKIKKQKIFYFMCLENLSKLLTVFWAHKWVILKRLWWKTCRHETTAMSSVYLLIVK